MKASLVLTISTCVFVVTASNHRPDYIHKLEARHALFRRADGPPHGGSIRANARFRKAERKASSARSRYHDSLSNTQDVDKSNAWLQSDSRHTPEVKYAGSRSVIDQGEQVVARQRQRAYAYSAAAQAARSAMNPERELRNSKKAEAAFAGAGAASTEMRYASTKAEHTARPDLYSSPARRKQLADEKAAYMSANQRATYLRGDGGRDSDSENDAESHGKPIPPLAASVHGLGRDPTLYKQIKAHQERNG